MASFLREIKKHIFIYSLFVKNSLMAQMEYRLTSSATCRWKRATCWSSCLTWWWSTARALNQRFLPDEILLFIGTFIALTGVYAGMFMINNFRLREKIKDGELDLLLTKPVSLQFMATLRQADLTIFSVDVIAGGSDRDHRLVGAGYPGDL